MYAQKEFWGIRTGGLSADPNMPSDFGSISKTDFEGKNPIIMHAFDSIHGMFPTGRLFQASNGKMYGVTLQGGAVTGPYRWQTGGVLFEYDLITDRYRVVTYFGSADVPYSSPIAGVIEASPGILFGSTSGTIYKHNLANQTTSSVATVPNFNSQLLTIQNEMNGTLVKSSNGYLYGTTKYYSACPQAAPLSGSFVRIHPTTNAFSYVHPFDCIPTSGRGANGSLVEGASGKLYGTTAVGGANIGPAGVAPGGSGILFEYDIAANTMTTKFDFNFLTTGSYPGPLVLGSNNKLYGILGANGTNPLNPSQKIEGSLYEYDMTTNIVTVLHYFEKSSFQGDLGSGPAGTLLKGSDGNLYGVTNYSIFRFNPADNSITRLGAPPFNQDMMELCRKPSYRYSETNSFIVCAGSPFTYDVHNTNAVSYVWKKNGVVLPKQIKSILSIASITLADIGSYTCEMTNECGMTIVPAITITVNPATSSTVTSSIPATADTIYICPGTSITLSGNNKGGIWSTGETASAIEVSKAGIFQIINTNTCGNTYSNTVTVEMYELPAPITISYDHTAPLCHGAPITFSGNTAGGRWQDGSTAGTFSTTVNTETDYVVTLEHSCGTITSNIIHLNETDLWEDPLPEIVTQGSLTICNGQGSVVLNSNRPTNAHNAWSWYRVGTFLEYLTFEGSVTVTEPGTYVLERSSYCFAPYRTGAVTISAVSESPPAPVVTGAIPICSNQSVTLTSSETDNLWSTGETTPAIIVSLPGTYLVSATNACGTSAWTNVDIAGLPSPDVNVAVIPESSTLVAIATDVTYQWLKCGGMGTVPIAIDGATEQSFTATESGDYALEVTNTSGCTNTSDCYRVNVRCDPPPVPAITVTGSVAICSNESATLTSSATADNVWSTGETTNSIIVSLPGTYTVSVTNACTTSTSNSVTLTGLPSPDIGVSLISGSSTLVATAADVMYQWMKCGEMGAEPVAIDGATEQNFTATESGNYAVKVTNASNCTNTSDCYTVNVRCEPPPVPVITVTGSVAICNNERVTLTSSATTDNVWSTGETTRSIIVSLPGTYTVSVTNACTTSTSNSVTITDLPSPDIGISLISGSSTLVATAAGVTYQWMKCSEIGELPIAIDGATEQNFTASTSGSYALEVTNASGCSDTSVCYAVDVICAPPVVPVITVVGSGAICSGESIILKSSVADNNIWSTGEIAPTIMVSSPGAYTVSIRNECGTSTSAKVDITGLPSPDVSISVTAGSNVLASVEMGGNYQWLKCGGSGELPVVIEGATQQNFSAPGPGSYAVEVTNTPGCTGTSQCFAVTELILSIDTNYPEESNLILYPNPSNDKIIVETNSEVEKISVVNMLGQTVLEFNNQKEIDVAKLPEGHYVVIAKSKNGAWRRTFVKKP